MTRSDLTGFKAALPRRKAGEARLTRGCRTVLEALGHTGELTSAQEIFAVLRQRQASAPGLTTVYRSLELLVDLGLVQGVDLGDGEKRYELVEPGKHHHHLVCRGCKQSIHLNQCVIEKLHLAIQEEYGFQASSHVLEIFGFCRRCLSKR